MIASGQDREEVSAQLRKNAPSSEFNLPGVLAGPAKSFQHMLFAAAVPFSGRQLLFGMAVLFLVVFVLAMLGAGMGGFGWSAGVVMLLLVITASIAIALPMAWLSTRATRRRKRVEEQFPVALDVFVRALRSGHPIAAAIDLLTQEMEDPIGSEFGVVADEVAYGADLTDALQEMADRWDNSDMRMFVVSLAVQKETGGNLRQRNPRPGGDLYESPRVERGGPPHRHHADGTARLHAGWHVPCEPGILPRNGARSDLHRRLRSAAPALLRRCLLDPPPD